MTRNRLQKNSMLTIFGFNFFDVFVYAFCIGFAFFCFYPMWYVFIGSLSEAEKFSTVSFNILPTWPPTLKYYISIITGGAFKRALSVSLFKTLFGASVSVILTAMMAYAVSKEHIKGMKAINFYVIFTMFFSGGLVPTFLLIKGLNMYDTIWALSLPLLMSVGNFVIMRSFFIYTIPQELEEAAAIDGANAVYMFFKIILPISKPTIATVFLFDAVAQWNDWYTYLVYCESPELRPVVQVLRKLLTDPNAVKGNSLAMLNKFGYLPPLPLKMTTIILAMLPIIVVYPFLQRYFVKGIMIGAVKG